MSILHERRGVTHDLITASMVNSWNNDIIHIQSLDVVGGLQYCQNT